MRNWKGWLALALGAAVFAAAGCEQAALPGVRYDPTPHNVVAEMMELAQTGGKDRVYDLGCGDGRIVIAAAKLGAQAVCVDIDPQRIRESRANAQRAGAAQRIVFLNQDLFDTALGEATVVTLFLSPGFNLKLRPKLWRELRPGTRVVSYVHDMGDWPPQRVRDVEGAHGRRKLFLWVIPPAPRAL